jgi:hypothetical protein
MAPEIVNHYSTLFCMSNVNVYLLSPFISLSGLDDRVQQTVCWLVGKGNFEGRKGNDDDKATPFLTESDRPKAIM